MFWQTCLLHTDAWLCILSSPPSVGHQSRHGVYPQWWRPKQTASKLSHAPCKALPPYSWPCGLLMTHWGKPWRHQIHNHFQNVANICNVCWCMRNACTVTACLARHVFRAVVPVADVSRVLADMFVAYGCMAVYSQQPTKCWAPKSSWCISSMVASQTDCQQVESCSLQGTAPIFLALWVAYDPLGQTMEASNSQSFANICNVCWSMRNACTVTACHARHVFRAVVPVVDVSRVLADMFVACGRMAVYSQQPTKCWAPKSSWCISSMVASQTDCQQVESCSLQGTAPIFLALWVAYDPLGQTM